jgi:nitrate reductase assembly molybdenum cofactor insertion protein NarJ
VEIVRTLRELYFFFYACEDQRKRGTCLVDVQCVYV